MVSKIFRIAAAGVVAAALSACGSGAPSGTAAVSSSPVFEPSAYSAPAYNASSNAAAYGTSYGSTYGSGSYSSLGQTGVPSALSAGSGTPTSALPCSTTPGVDLSSPSGLPTATVPGVTSCSASDTTGSTASGGAAQGAAAGFSASITETQTTGLFTKSVIGVTVAVTNNDATEESHYIIVSFTRNNDEVAVAYHQVDLTPGAQQTLDFPVPTDSSGHYIDADNAHVEVKDSLL